MKITKEKIKSLNPCAAGWAYYLKNQESDLSTFLLKLNSDKTAVDENDNFHGSNWARWLFTNLMTKTQCVEIAVYSAEQVIHIYESKYESDAPRKAIEAAKNYIENPTYATADSAYAAARAFDPARRELQEKIIMEAVMILDSDKQ